MKPHLKVGSYFIASPIQGALGLTIIPMLVCKQTTYRSVSFKIIKDILWSKEELILHHWKVRITFQSNVSDKSCFQLFQQAAETEFYTEK
jgi:hypothetical protein